MPSTYPGSDDSFTEPSSPGSTALSSAGSGSRSHTQHHRDLGDAIEAIEANVAILTHDHSTADSRPTAKLSQANTHESPDTDSATSSLHHTIGAGANQAAAGNHTHTQATSHNSPDTDSATSSLHHTIGSGANQSAAGNHTHTQATSHSSPDTDSATSSLHHTIGTGANQGAAGDHKHPGFVISFTASTSATSTFQDTEAAVLTHGSSVTLKAGEAYRFEIGGIAGANSADGVRMRLRKNTSGGTIVVALIDYPFSPGTWTLATYMRNNTGADISFTPVMTAVKEPTGTGTSTTIGASSTNPRYMKITYAGNASDFASAVSVT